MSDFPPPYGPHPSSSAAFPPALGPQPAGFPGTSYQTFPQTYAGGGDRSYYQGGPGPSGAAGPYMNQPGYQGYQGGPSGPPGQWDYNKTQQPQPTTTVVVVEQQRHQEEVGGGAEEGFLAACYAALCCCCLMDMLDDLASEHSDH